MRLNRANARVRDQDRVHNLHKKQTPQDQACELVWRELVGELFDFYYFANLIVYLFS